MSERAHDEATLSHLLRSFSIPAGVPSDWAALLERVDQVLSSQTFGVDVPATAKRLSRPQRENL